MITPKMVRVLKLVAAAAAKGRGHELAMDELVGLAGSGASKQAMQSTVRILERKGYLSRVYATRSGKVLAFLLPTVSGVEIARSYN